MSKKDKSAPITNVRSEVGTWNFIPTDALKEIIEWPYIQKSPCSHSFYNKPKEWGKTEDCTIRISDHWNFYAKKRDDKLHSRTTNIITPDGVWAKGIYDKNTDMFTLIHIYGTEIITKQELKIIKEGIPKIEAIKIPFPQEIIDIRRKFTRDMENGNVFIEINGVYKNVTFLTRSKLTYIDNGVNITLKSDPGISWFNKLPKMLVKINEQVYEGYVALKEANLIQ